MPYTSPIQPLCYYCGKRIAKHTRTIYVYATEPQYKSGDYVVGVLHSKAECQRHTNQQVVSLDYSYETDERYERTGKRHVHRFSVWDGESYQDQFFCNGTCALRFAYLLARSGRCTSAYNAAVARQKEKAA